MKPRIKTDTTSGTIVFVVGNEIMVDSGIRINTISITEQEVPCPDNYFGCMVLHYGDVASIISSKYVATGKLKDNMPTPVNERYIIKFISENGGDEETIHCNK